MKEEGSETALKQINYGMEDINYQILDIIKRQRTSANTEPENMYIQAMYLTFQEMAKDDLTQKHIL